MPDASQPFSRTPDLACDGFAIIEAVAPAETVNGLIADLDRGYAAGETRQRQACVYAMRNLLSAVPAARRAAESRAIRALVEPVLGPHALPVRGLLFDKTPAANWKVAWHQDLSIAVARRIDLPGFGPWSVKAGVPHVQPPVEILQNMLTVRLHLDDCGPDNGPLNVLPGSHADGVLSPDGIAAWRRRTPPVACLVSAGGAVVMRPLLLHASSAAARPGRRRVVHLEFAAGPLPGGLEWHAA